VTSLDEHINPKTGKEIKIEGVDYFYSVTKISLNIMD
jgi:hypothetical protein